ncbi:5-hydroxytryptamine receptor 1F [Trichoplax sp. H2]|nr:5-hydroxytryptamine receptor 1F [Trichoplax sp. H2]|eukprot:RDD36039.1 5-hydroxytryptamine receptor 1F [Trichoplax sp. H2]
MSELQLPNVSSQDYTNRTTAFQFLQIAQIFFSLPSFLSIILNSAILNSIYFSKELSKSPTYYLIGNMVISDIATASLFMTLPIVTVFSLPYAVVDAICRILSLVTGISFMASVLSLTSISIDRYLSILKPMLLASRTKKLKMFKIVIVFIWLLSITASLPFIYLTGALPGPTNSCALMHRGRIGLIFYLLITIILYIVPLAIMSILYFKIYQFLLQRYKEESSKEPGEVKTKTFLDNAKRKSLIRTLIIVTVVFALMTWPFFAMTLGMSITGIGIDDLERESLFLFILCTFAVSFTVCTPVVNPLLLIKYDKNIRSRSSILYNRIRRRISRHNKITNTYTSQTQGSSTP